MAVGIHEYGTPEANLPLNKVILGDCVEVMRVWPADSIDLVVTSPPYWGLRDYGTETVQVWGGRLECVHEWSNSVLPAGYRSTEDRKSPTKTSEAISRRDKWQSSNFCSKCGAWHGSLGLEPHPQMFIDHFVEICRDIRRVLKPSGTFWLNLGDTYYGSGGKGGQYEKFMPDKGQPDHYRQSSKTRSNWLQPKQLLGMPWRVAIALQHDGWILRNDVIWHKPNHMPSSVKDRLTNAHEHVFLFAKNRRYYFDLDAIRKPHEGKDLNDYPEYKTRYKIGETAERGSLERGKQHGFKGRWLNPKGKNPGDVLSGSKYLEQDHPHSIRVKGGHTGDYTHPRGKNPGDLWRIPTRPFPGAHFATFPPKLIEPIIKAGSPQWICSKCGKPRTRITEPTPEYAKKLGKSVHNHKDDLKRGMRYDKVYNAEYVTTGWTDCGCGEGWVGGVVLDPFGGSGTVGQVARRLGRRFIIIEIKHEYAEMARQRVRGKYKPTPPGVVKLTQIMEAEK